MELEAARRPARLLAAGGAILYLAVLSLDWYEASVDVAGAVSVDASGSGWSSAWGLLAGVLAVVLLLATWLPERLRPALAVVSAAIGLVVATAFAAFTGGADVEVAQTVAVDVDTTLWPAWIGLGLAVAVAVAELVALLPAGGSERSAASAGPA
jgi:hypothetical protein